MSTPVPRPTWLKVTSLLAAVGAVAWPVLAMLGLIGALPAQVVLNVGIVTAALAYVSVRKIKHDRDKDIESLGSVLKFVNTLLIPILLVGAATGLTLGRTRRAKATKTNVGPRT